MGPIQREGREERKMAQACEICGRPTTTASRITIDGAVLRVCQNCAGKGTLLRSPPPKPIPFRIGPVHHETIAKSELEIDPDYNIIVKQAREKMGLTQEALGRAINEKPSVISHVESKKLKPDPILARKLMHHLRVNLLVPSSELET